MSGPVPSPSMKGMIGWSGTLSLPPLIEIVSPGIGEVLQKRAMGKSRGADYGDLTRNSKRRWTIGALASGLANPAAVAGVPSRKLSTGPTEPIRRRHLF